MNCDFEERLAHLELVVEMLESKIFALEHNDVKHNNKSEWYGTV